MLQPNGCRISINDQDSGSVLSSASLFHSSILFIKVGAGMEEDVIICAIASAGLPALVSNCSKIFLYGERRRLFSEDAEAAGRGWGN